MGQVPPEEDDGWTGGGRWFDVATVAFMTLVVGVFAVWSLLDWESFRHYWESDSGRNRGRAWVLRFLFPPVAVVCGVWLVKEVRGYLRWRRRLRSRRRRRAS